MNADQGAKKLGITKEQFEDQQKVKQQNALSQVIETGNPNLDKAQEQLAKLQGPNRIVAELSMAKLDRAVYSNRQLEAVMEDFWFNHFNVFANKGDDGSLAIVTLSPDWEAAFADALIGQGGEEKQLAMAPSKLQEFIRSVRDNFERASQAGDMPVLLTGPVIRPYVRSIVERFRPQTVVMSQNEIHPKARLKTVGVV